MHTTRATIWTLLLVFACEVLRSSAAAPAPSSTFSIREYGAKGDGVTLDTKAIDEAISACTKQGGGTVLVPPGVYLSGPIHLAQNVALHLEAGAMIKASPKLQDYDIESGRGSGESERAGLLTARNANNVTITGRGVIEGNGSAFVDSAKLHQGIDYAKKYTRQGEDFMNPKFGTQHGPLAHGPRPGNLVRFFNCTNVLIEGVTIQNSPTWTVQISGCERVTVRTVNINSFGSDRRDPNDDGIDLVESRFVHISDCDIQTGDDCIAVFGSEKIAVSNCTLSSRSAGIRVGFTGQDIRDCIFGNLVIHDSNRGLGVFVRGERSVENVLFHHILISTRLYTGHWCGKGEPIQVSALRWDPQAKRLGKIKNVRFSNIRAESEAGIIVYGCPKSVIEDGSFSDLKLRIRRGELQALYGGNFDLRSTADFSTALFSHDIPALYATHVAGLTVERFQLSSDSDLPSFFTEAMRFEQFRDIEIDGFKGRPLQGKHSAIALKDGAGVTIRNCQAAEGTDVFLSQSGVSDARAFLNNDLTRAQRVCEPAMLNFQITR